MTDARKPANATFTSRDGRQFRVYSDPAHRDGMVAIFHSSGWSAMVAESDIERDQPPTTPLPDAIQAMLERSVVRIVEVMEEAAADDIDNLIDALTGQAGLDHPQAEQLVYRHISAAFNFEQED